MDFIGSLFADARVLITGFILGTLAAPLTWRVVKFLWGKLTKALDRWIGSGNG